MLLLMLGEGQTRGVNSEARDRLTIRDFSNEVRNEKPGCRIRKFIAFQIQVHLYSHNGCVLKFKCYEYICAAMCNLRIDRPDRQTGPVDPGSTCDINSSSIQLTFNMTLSKNCKT